MKLRSRFECETYVDAELRRVTRSFPDFRTQSAPTDDFHGPVAGAFSRRLCHRDNPDFWYTIEARPASEEFLVWFGNYQEGFHNIFWIMRPAVHIAFRDLAPNDDIPPLRFSLSDVLIQMIGTLRSPRGGGRFPMNTFSLT